MLETLKLPSSACGGEVRDKDSRDKLLPYSLQRSVGNRLGSLPSQRLQAGTAERGTHCYQKLQFPYLHPAQFTHADVRGGLGELVQLCSSLVLYQEFPSRVPTDLHCPGHFGSFCFKKQLERYRATEPLPSMGRRDVIPYQ